MIKDIINKAQIENKRVYIYAHKTPDSDAINSAKALMAYLRQFDVKSAYVISKPIGKDIFPLKNLNPKSSISIIVDTSTLDYAENTKFLKSEKNDIYVYDHHLKNGDNKVIEEELGLPENHVLRDTSASSNCEILLNDFDKKKITPEIANYMLEGVIADTAKLMYIKNSTLENVATLIELGGDYVKNYEFIARRGTLKIEAGMGHAFLNTQKIDLGDSFGLLCAVNNEDVKKYFEKYNLRDIHKKIPRMQNLYDCSFDCVISENEPGDYDVDFRSSTEYKNFDVQSLAVKFGGGGHYNASGCHFYAKDGHTLQSVAELMTNEIKEIAKTCKTENKNRELSEADKKLALIFDKTDKLRNNVTPLVLREVKKLRDDGANYAGLILSLRSYREYLIQNELSALIPDSELNKTENFEMTISEEKYKQLKRDYNFSKEDLKPYKLFLESLNVKKPKINLPEQEMEK